jgi:hypothetical protein
MFFGISCKNSGCSATQTCVRSVFLGVRSSSCGRQTVDQFVLVSGLPLGPMTRFIFLFFFRLTITFIIFPMASSLTRKRVCSSDCLQSLVRSLTTSNQTLSSHQRLCSLSVASYDSQGLRWRYSNPPPHGEEVVCLSNQPRLFICLQQYFSSETVQLHRRATSMGN